MSKSITILGSTGSIGQTTLRLMADAPEQFTANILTAGSNATLLIEQAKQHRPKAVVIEDEAHYAAVKEALQPLGIAVAAGRKALLDAAREKTDILIAAIVGAAALEPVLAAIKQGTTIGLANKECLVCAGDLVMHAARQHRAAILPIDSEHNAIFQALQGHNPQEVEHITLTASGGPFRALPVAALKDVTPAQAVKHPNWSMGAKISVDSATMMNKGLEVIEAYHLFQLPSEKIDVLVHPQSIIHGLVHFTDGSVLAALSEPDMAVPIAHALAFPKRLITRTKRLNLAHIGQLQFETPDPERFPAIPLTRAVLAAGGSASATFNAANEVAVEAFLQGEIGFTQIIPLVHAALESIPSAPLADIDAALAADTLAREKTRTMIRDNLTITHSAHGTRTATTA